MKYALTAGLAAGIVAAALSGAAQAASVVIVNGHSDIGVGLEDGHLHPHVHDANGEYEAADVLYFFSSAEKEARPASSSWNFLGIPSGATYWCGRATSIAGRQYIGMATEEIDPLALQSTVLADDRVLDTYGTDTGPWVKWQVTGVNAPAGGNFFMFSSTSTVWVNSADGIGSDDFFAQQAGGHEHTNFAFTAAGACDVTFLISTTLADGTVLSESATYHFEASNFAEPIPVPAAAGLGLLGLAGVTALRRRRQKA